MSGHTSQHSRYLGIMTQRALTGGTRTCIQTPGIEHTPEDLQPDKIEQILNKASLVYFDGRLTASAILLAKAARQRGVPVLVEAERLREGLDELLKEADYLCTSAHFPKVIRCCLTCVKVKLVVWCWLHACVCLLLFSSRIKATPLCHGPTVCHQQHVLNQHQAPYLTCVNTPKQLKIA